MYCLQTRELTFRFRESPALTAIDLQVPTGSIYGFLGPNGAGKTTTLRLLLGLLRPQNGEILVFGSPLRAANRPWVMRRIGAMVENPAFYGNLTARENLLLLQRIHRCPVSRIDEVLELVGLSATQGKCATQFSLGMKQRLLLAQALLHDPDILVLDEPTAGLDPRQRVAVRNLIGEIAGEKIVLLCTHVVQDVEFIARELILMNQGLIIRRGSPHALEQELEGQVWELTVAEEQLPDVAQYGTVCGVSRQQEGILVRLLSAAKPPLPCAPARPDLEDVYLFHFGEGAAL